MKNENVQTKWSRAIARSFESWRTKIPFEILVFRNHEESSSVQETPQKDKQTVSQQKPRCADKRAKPICLLTIGGIKTSRLNRTTVSLQHVEDSSYGSDDSRDEEMAYSSSDGEEEQLLMYGIRGPRRSTVHEWRFDSLRISHILDMNDMLEIIQDILSYMYSLVPDTLSLIVYLRRTGSPIRDKILFVIQAMVWLICHVRMCLAGIHGGSLI